eukprot:COSAG05_NODE_3881_length_1792_cov_24.680063_2_plen_95_part_00
MSIETRYRYSEALQRNGGDTHALYQFERLWQVAELEKNHSSATSAAELLAKALHVVDWSETRQWLVHHQGWLVRAMRHSRSSSYTPAINKACAR